MRHCDECHAAALLSPLSRVQLFGILCTAAARLLCPWDSLGKSTTVGCHAFLQGIFLTQGSNPSLLHCRQILYHWNPMMSTMKRKWRSLSCVWLFATPWSIQSMEFSRPEYWSGLTSFPENLPNPGIKPRSPALQEHSLPAELPGKPRDECYTQR